MTEIAFILSHLKNVVSSKMGELYQQARLRLRSILLKLSIERRVTHPVLFAVRGLAEAGGEGQEAAHQVRGQVA